MDDSNDEGGKIPESVSDYTFENANHGPVCFSILPLWMHDRDGPVCSGKQIYLCGLVDNGLRKIYIQATAWKVELESSQPKLYTLAKNGKWLLLSRPKAKYAEIIREILIVIQCLHYIKYCHGANYKSMWVVVGNHFRCFDIKPTILDLRDHVPLMREISSRDVGLEKSQLLHKLLEEVNRNKNMRRKDAIDVKNPDFIDDGESDDGSTSGDNDESDEEQDCFDHVCAICDNGGEILSCEGHCLRSFHATKDLDTGSQCATLGYTQDQVEAIPRFLCKNCLYKKHQCFACGELGSSDKSNAPEVFTCISATCGHFYHPKCVAKLLYPSNDGQAVKEEINIASGQPFLCPIHRCFKCNEVEDKKVKDLQFALCRRCPRSYHRKCLPKKIGFTITDDVKFVRAWEGLLPNRILIFCLKHKIDSVLLTPTRDHIKFPKASEIKDTRPQDNALKYVQKAEKKLPYQELVLKPPTTPSDVSFKKRSQIQQNLQTAPIQCKRLKTMAVNGQPGTLNFQNKGNKDVKVVKEKPLHQLVGLAPSQSARVGPSLLSIKIPKTSIPLLDTKTERRIMTFITKSPAYSLTLDYFIKQKDIPSTHAYSAKHVDKAITIGQVEGSVEAIGNALQMIEKDNQNLQYAKAVCEPELLSQVLKWKSKLSVYLGPFLHGLRYTSFGRHFTKVEKLKEIVERLHFYVEAGDTIVDFCCGANDFSVLMKEKLEAVKKECFYRNYDIIPPKNDFNFVKSDWMKVNRKDLPDGNQLIMGLNPPFGVKGALANKFIDKALEFLPKLLILIVPKETQRLDAKRGIQYDLIWEDDKKLAGKSFYLPGAVDSSEKQLEQWNIDAPPLYLWSRRDWTRKHREIAMQHGHVEGVPPGGSHNLTERPKIGMTHGSKYPSSQVFNRDFTNVHKRKFEWEGTIAYTKDSVTDTNINKKHKPVSGDRALVIGQVDESSDMSISPTHSDPGIRLDGACYTHQGSGLHIDDRNSHDHLRGVDSMTQIHCPPSSQTPQAGSIVLHQPNLSNLGYCNLLSVSPDKAANFTGVQQSQPGADSRPQICGQPSFQGTRNTVVGQSNTLDAKSGGFSNLAVRPLNYNTLCESLPGAEVGFSLPVRGQMPPPAMESSGRLALTQSKVSEVAIHQFSDSGGRTSCANHTELGSKLQMHGQPSSWALRATGGGAELIPPNTSNLASHPFSDHAHRPSGPNSGNYSFPKPEAGRAPVPSDSIRRPGNVPSPEAPRFEPEPPGDFPSAGPEPLKFVSSSGRGGFSTFDSCGWLDE